MDFESLVNKQYELGEQILQLITNCKKAPKERRTSQFYATKLERLRELGSELHKNHDSINSIPNKPTDDEYFTNSYYNETINKVNEYTKVLERQAVELEGDVAGKEPVVTNEQLARKCLRNIKALLEAINKNLDEIASKRNEDHPQSYYTVKAAVLEKHMMDLTHNNATLWDTTERDTVEDYTLKTYYELESKVESTLIELHERITPESNANTSRLIQQPPPNNPNVQLPRITLPKFNGDYLQWVTFKDLFLEIVHQASITDSQRMHYLTQSLVDEPKTLIKHLPSTGTNYAAAWKILTSRYDNKRLLVSTLLNKLLSQPAVKNESPAQLKSLHDVTKECIHGLRAQGLPIQHWDALISHIVMRKVDQATQTAFEQGLDDCRRLLTQDEVLNFLERRFQSLEVRSSADKAAKRTCGSVVNTDGKCNICNKDKHCAQDCAVFKKAPPKQKWRYVKSNRLCANCLRPGHQSNACKSSHCTKCTKRHNTLLHPEENTPQAIQQTASSLVTTDGSNDQTLAKNTTAVSLLTNQPNHKDNFVLLGRARILVVGVNGYKHECKALLDSGSQVSLVTERFLKKLGIAASSSQLQLEGVGQKETSVDHRTLITIESKFNDYTTELTAHVIPKIVSNQPAYNLTTEGWHIPSEFTLADPDFDKPGRIDCLIGAELFWNLLTSGKLELGENLPVLHNTVFGWIVAGSVGKSHITSAVCGICTTNDLENLISKFWETEEIPEGKTNLTKDDLMCEAHFLQNTTRSMDGRFEVKLPLKEHPSVLADSKGMAYERFKAIERRLSKDPPLKDQYVAFMREYESLGHMTEIKAADIKSAAYYIPHHCVVRPDSLTTKLRVVFDASAHKPSGPSLNDIMHTGPTVQSELFAILLRFRMHRYALKTDVEKMYRQIWVNKDDRNLQLILWREQNHHPMKIFQLNTVTYGTRAAPYLATRCLVQLATDHQSKYPYGSAALRRDFYVDDGIMGADTIAEALDTQQQLIKILGSAGMNLKKWCANDPRLLNGIALEDQEVNLNFESKEAQSTKTLGLIWLPKTDVFCIKANINSSSTTKRGVISDLAHIYDPLGLVGPVVVTAKIFIQQLWQLKFDWDTALPAALQKLWDQFRTDMPAIEKTQIPRYVFGSRGSRDELKIELHAFADASERAYGAAIYVRVIQRDGSIKVNLLCSKSRVAPLKLQTIPKLELCAALVAAELVTRVKNDLDYQSNPCYMWSDSTIALAWINQQPGTLQPFVAHRILKIRQMTHPDQWRHVPSKQNPADILSRGLKPHELSTCAMWFYGPLFLYQQPQAWPAPYIKVEEPPIIVAAITQHSTNNETMNWIYSIPSKNSFKYVQRVVGYVLRFIRNTKQPKESRSKFKALSPIELDAALTTIVKQIQHSDFSDMFKILRKDRMVPRNHSLSNLVPFIDEEGIIRVGGRLSLSQQTYDATHQMLLPGNDPLVKLLIEKLHKETKHSAYTPLLGHVRQQFWPLKAKTLIRSVINRCVVCTRAKPKFYTQIMGNLPSHRVTPARPFLHSGVDYCGPFSVHFKGRGRSNPQKAYLAIFCCFATKAVHLELVTELTTEAFLGALKRFIGRRGHCQTLYCDNATNFVGAKNQLSELKDVIYSDDAKESIIRACSERAIDFRFIPPRSPHFGGLWEAAVKSAKHLLLKNVSPRKFTYEEFETLVIEVEAMLNSRPLIPHPSNPNDLNAITPGHALIGSELTSSVDVRSDATLHTKGDRWQQVSEVKHQFWKRWSAEYLHELQQRHKWKQPVRDVEINTLVIIRENNIPVLQWPLGRIVKVIKGEDGFVRVCDVKTQKGVFRRELAKLAPLFPKNEDDVSSKPTTDQQDEYNSAILKRKPNESQPKPVSLVVSIPLSRLRKAVSSNDTPCPKRSRIHPNLLVALLSLMMLPLVLCSPITVTTFNGNAGLYFQQIGSVRLSTTTWNMVVFYDLEPYQRELQLLKNGTTSLQNLCQQKTNDTTCSFLIRYFEEEQATLETKLHLISTKRTKRGAVDVVGNLANSLFGVLDSNYEAKMSETINELRANDHHLDNLIKNQTSLIDSTINIMKQTQLNSKAKFDELDDRINQLLYGHALDTPLSEVHFTSAILTLAVQMFITVSTLQGIQSSIMDVLIDSHHGKLNPLLLTPKQLKTEVIRIKSHLPQHRELPIDAENLLQIYRLLTVDGTIAENHVVFSIQLPLSDDREFQLFYLVPVIAVINGSLTSVNSKFNLMAISPHRDEYFALTESQLQSCLELKPDSYLCHNIQASYHNTADTSNCEMDLFANETSPKCMLQTIEEATVWHQLRHQNQWIYVTTKPLKLNAVCNNEAFQLTLNGSGIIQLQPTCVIRNEMVTIQGHQELKTQLHTSYISTGMAIKNNPSVYNPGKIPEANVFHTKFKELDAIQKQLHSITASTLPNGLTSYHHGAIFGYILGILGIGFLTRYLWRRYRNRQQTPTAAPRLQHFNVTEC